MPKFRNEGPPVFLAELSGTVQPQPIETGAEVDLPDGVTVGGFVPVDVPAPEPPVPPAAPAAK